MKHMYVTLNNVQTSLLTWGDPFQCNGNDVILCITGNPGLVDFYKDFGAELHKHIGMPVCIVGHAGHEDVPDKKSNILTGQEHLFNLEGQIQHKLDLINNYVDKHSRLHLIGHSIGAWLILELLRDNENINSRITSVNLLFPTIQKMAESKNGKFLNNVIRQANLFVIFLFYLAILVPTFILVFLVKLYLKVQSQPLHYSDALIKFLRPTVGQKVLFLAYNEMDCVKKLNIEVLEKIKHYTNVIYSTHDNWSPVSYMEDLQIFQPQISLQEVDLDHAFVLKSSEKVAELVTDFIKLKI